MNHRMIAVATAVALTLVLPACTARDRAGGRAADDVVTLTFAQPNNDPPAQLAEFADEVDRASRGTLKIEFESAWRLGEAGFEADTIRDVQDGTVDMAWVGARAFDRAGATAFQALLAPMLVDSHDLQGAVFHEGIPTEMMAGLDELGIVGVGVLPGPMRKLLSRGEPLTAPSALAGLTVGIQGSDLADATFEALGATAVDLPGSADIGNVDAYEQQLASIWGNHYESQGAVSVTGNLDLWPRPLVVFIGEEAWTRLTGAQQQVLRQSAANAVEPALEASRTEDAETIASVCQTGITLPQLGDAELTAFRQALQPVYDRIAASPESAEWLDRIRALKEQTDAPPEAASCDAAAAGRSGNASGGPDASPIEGTYQRVHTVPVCPGFEPSEGEADRLDELVFDGDIATFYFYREHDGSEPLGLRIFDWSSSLEVFRDTLTLTHDAESITMHWTLDGDVLTIRDVQGGCIDAWVMSSTPWTKVHP